jgi:hypothetical protein
VPFLELEAKRLISFRAENFPQKSNLRKTRNQAKKMKTLDAEGVSDGKELGPEDGEEGWEDEYDITGFASP